ncbi:MAG: hypothetical protein EOS76_01345 [Mesorhizobium sp.]|nr:hypothetical protein EJ072_06840 [Mesorhizobium sp. M2A.F.Ca.ET.046.03.2.1]AZO71644.1 hypothetical protein EJ067_11215 [Mesorhizobium sp. M1D.F.Ca.ET.043.01.1.1]RVC77481.1 hypothetical protein EN766_11490 [Mesorhizobium sp. M2A.F.Ca.ET.046.02.1.1]RWB49778.1 MAG: hypothetical protein EOQ44_01255 [Mesorhizobium sp.]RWE22474.1 MAG: hypothetical protein EOS76_01345 [Mesorhizobium sp.]
MNVASAICLRSTGISCAATAVATRKARAVAVNSIFINGFLAVSRQPFSTCGSLTPCARSADRANLACRPGSSASSRSLNGDHEIPARSRYCKAIPAIFGLTPVLDESGENHRIGRNSRCGDGMTRTLLYEAAQALLTRMTK